METGKLEITIKGKNKQGIPISPKSLELRDAEFLIASATDLLFPEKRLREEAYLEFQDSSLKTQIISALIVISGVTQNLIELKSNPSLGRFSKSFQNTMENLQSYVIKNGYEIYINTSDKESPVIKIDPSTKYFLPQPIMVDTEIYLYGKIIDAGGSADRVNIHLQTKEYGTVVIASSEKDITAIKKNPLFKQYMAHVSAKQNLQNGEFETGTYKLISLKEFNPTFDKKYNERQIKKASKWMNKFKPEEILGLLRGTT